MRAIALRPSLCALISTVAACGAGSAQGGETTVHARENVYRGELISYPGPYGFHIGKAAIILVSDGELLTLAENPDAVLDLSLTFDKHEDSLRGICEKAQAAGHRTLLVSFDHFFKQYRPGQDTPRTLMPDTDEYIAVIAKVAAFAAQYGLALELSLLSPLEIGPGYRARTGESGVWLHYRKGLRDPRTGAFSVQLWRQQQWVNNKGPVTVEDAGVRVFAFREARVHGTQYLAVNPSDIVEVTPVAQVEVWEGARIDAGDYAAQRVRVYGQGMTEIGSLDRVLVVQAYRTPEMDYFSDSALPFLQDLCDRYVSAGVNLNGLYSDEMHIQQDWGYFTHHDNGQFAVRYVSDGFRRRFAEAYGAEYEDFAKYLVYFCYGQEDTRNDLDAARTLSHVFGPTPADIARTALFRARYYRMLQDGVVDLFVSAKRYLEQRLGHLLETRAHATWAESPTIDRWDVGREHHPRNQYEYTPNFLWSCTVHQAASACHDYFKWGEYLTGTGNDHSEGGWLDRNYYGLALGCSTGIVNDVPYSYAAHWGSPGAVAMRHGWLQAAFGTASSPLHGLVQDLQHRDVDVLTLYPLDLVSADERFGSWVVQYGYTNYITTAKLLAMGEVRNGSVHLAGRHFSTLVALFEPFPPRALLELMRDLAEQGGRVVWCGPPPLIAWDGTPLLEEWSALFGARYVPRLDMGWSAPGRRAEFSGTLAGVEPQIILTDFIHDRVHPVAPSEGALAVAGVGGRIAGTHRTTAAGGSLTYLGFRPRDDQSASLGYDVRTLFDVLSRLGAYPPTGAFDGGNDNTEYLSRTGAYLCCRFPNGAVSIAPHLRHYEESWPGGFGRRPDEDEQILADNPPPSPVVALDDFQVNGHTVDYEGQGVVTFRVDAAGNLVGFAGHHCTGITVDGRAWRIASTPLSSAFWAPVAFERRVGGGAVAVALFAEPGEVRIPLAGLPGRVAVLAEGPTPGSRGTLVASRVEDDALVITVGSDSVHRWLYIVPE